MEKKVCFIGHRTLSETKELRKKTRETIEKLIQEENAVFFLFGSKSDFDSLCHDVVTELQAVYPQIQRIAYTCRHEYAPMKKDKAEIERIWSGLLKYPVHIRDYDGEYEHPTKYVSGKASYVERNQSLINDSDFCVFYFDLTYRPPRRKTGNRSLTDYQPKSGTGIAYEYALQKKKTIINLCD